MGMFDGDPDFENLDALRKSGYRGAVDENGEPTSLSVWGAKHGYSISDDEPDEEE